MPPAPGLLRFLAACMIPAYVSGCGEKYVKDGFGDTLIFGKITVIAADGADMTKYCKFRISKIDDPSREFEKSGELSQYGLQRENHSIIESLDADGSYRRRAQPFPTSISIGCKQTVSDSFSMATLLVTSIPSFITVRTPPTGAAAYFGDIIITLKPDHTLALRNAGYGHAGLYGGDLPVAAVVPELTGAGAKWGTGERTLMHMYVP